MQQLLNKISQNNIQRQNSRLLMTNKPNNFIQQTYYSTNLSNFRQGNDSNSVIQKLLQTQDLTNIRKITSSLTHQKRRQLLVDTEERIFSQVLGLVGQIDELHLNIMNTSDQIKQLNIEHPEIEEKVKFHGYTQRLTYQQCNDLQQQNLFLLKKIREIQSKQTNSLQNILQIEKQKLQELKQQLQEGQNPNDKSMEDRKRALKNSIAELQRARSSHLTNYYPEFQKLKNQNETLRKRTIQNLREKQNANEQEEQLVEYLRREEENRLQFMQQLKKMKDQYKRIRGQNQSLAEKVPKIQKNSSKENSNFQNKSIDTENKSLKVESYVTKRAGGNRLSQFQSVIKMMQNVKK